MKQQILVVQGGETFNTYDEYIAWLRGIDFSLEKMSVVSWKRNLENVLDEKFQVIYPDMPNPFNAKYLEWKIYFEKIIPSFTENVILLGHSLGAIFLLEYLSENDYPKPIKATLLVSAPYGTSEVDGLADFIIGSDLKKFAEQAGKIILYHSRDDKVVPFSHFEKYAQILPNAEQRIFEDRGHFNQTDFPEIVDDIKRINYANFL